jgi:hypothetical protein
LPDYDLRRLGSRAFEQLIVSLGRLELGARMSVFGDGPDGGREATYDGTIDWSAESHLARATAGTWDGYTVIQAKFQVKAKPTPHDDAVWLQGQIRNEIDGWIKAAENLTRTRLPDYLIFVTNIDLSPLAQTGGIDTLTDYVSRKLAECTTANNPFHVRDFVIWHADQIRSMIDGHQDVRWAFPGLLTVGDVLALVGAGELPVGTMEFADPLRQEVVRSLRRDRHVRLSQAGGSGEAVLWLDDIAMDLPALIDQDPDASVHAVRRILELGDANLKRQLPDPIERPNVVVVGGPGQGKSTVSQLVAQAYRAALLELAAPGAEAAKIIDGTRSALERLGLSVPNNRRWPVRVDLAKYAESLSAGEKSLLRWISEEIRSRADQDITPAQLNRWLYSWPWALILDGLDEVPVVEIRRKIYAAINDLLSTADDCDADLLVVVTTRPTGYDERFPSGEFEHLHLERLSAPCAVQYAERIVAIRFADDAEVRSKLVERLRSASRDAITGRLMETPLQVMIMSFIVERYPNLPPDRFTLFDFYYTTVFDREGAKDNSLARFLIDNRAHVERLHEQVALVLQASAESAEGAEASMSPEALKALALRQLEERGFGTADAEKTAGKIEQAAMTRLVLLTPREEGVGFEVRSLQEYMAARALAEGQDTDVIERLRVIAHSPHWRNTWLLSAGKLLRSDRFEAQLARLLRDLDNDPRRIGDSFPTGPLLAADMLGDNLAHGRPNFEAGLVRRLLAVIEHPPVIRVGAIAGALLDAAAQSEYRTMIYDRLGAAADSGVARRAAASHLLKIMNDVTRQNGPLASIRIAQQRIGLTETEARALDHWQTAYRKLLLVSDMEDTEALDLAEHLTAHAESIGYQPPLLDRIRGALTALARVQFARVSGEGGAVCVALIAVERDPMMMVEELADPEFASAVEEILTTVPDSDWVVAALVGWSVKPALDRLPVGHDVTTLVERARAREAKADGDW